MISHIVKRSNGLPANAVRRKGYVTEAMVRKYGSFAKAVAALNAAGGDMRRVEQEIAA